jgi:hypothetical protein
LLFVAEKTSGELYDLEYQACADRYEHIYSAIWTQFNYFLVAAGVLLGFGKDALGVPLAGILACVSLVFWYWATFEPLNRYGDSVARRAAILERIRNRDVFDLGPATRGRGMRHFILYERRRSASDDTSEAVYLLDKKLPYLLLCTLGIVIVTAHVVSIPVPFVGQVPPTVGLALSVLPILVAGIVKLKGMQLQAEDQVLPLESLMISPDDQTPNTDSASSTSPSEYSGRLKQEPGRWLYWWLSWALVAVVLACGCYGSWLVGQWSGGSALRPSSLDYQCTTTAVGVCLLTSSYMLPLLFFRNRMRRSVRTSVRFASAMLHVMVCFLIAGMIGQLGLATPDKTDIHLRVDPKTGKVSIEGGARS